jgi:hypothetical protein
MRDNKKADDLKPNSFLTVLQRKEVQESLLTDASKALGEACLAAKQTRKKATVTLTLTIEPQKGGALGISAAIAGKVPSTRDEQLTIFFVDKDGALVRDNPDQKELSLTSHDGGAAAESESRAHAAH